MTDKPAATGSGEPLCAKCNQPIRGHDLTGHRIELPTPPASQSTVTPCECGEHADPADHWLSEKVHDGLGSFTLCVTEDGDIGLFRNDEEKCIGSGDTVNEAIHNAMCRELALLRAAEQK